MFDKQKTKLVIDVLMFICMMALAGIGFLMKYVLLSGREAQVKYGTKVDLSLLGLDRHDWGTIHLIIAYVLGALLLLHIVLNWKQIVNMLQRLISGPMARKVATVLFVIMCVFLGVFPFMVNPEIQEKVRGEGQEEKTGERDFRRGRTEIIQQPQNSPYEVDYNSENLFAMNNFDTTQ